MRRSMMAVVGAVALLSLAGAALATGTFNNPNYTYTQLWSAGPNPARATWPDYNATAGKVAWRDSTMTGYVADLNPATGALSNLTTFAPGQVYEASFSVGGNCLFYQDVSTTSSLAVSGGTIQAYNAYRYDIAAGTSTKVFDISTLAPAAVEALTGYRGNEFGFYLGQGGSDNELLMSVRDVNGQMDVVKYDIAAQTFTNLTSSLQAEYDAQYLGADTSELLYWTESYPTHAVRGISILSGGTEETIVSTTAPDMYLSARWGKDHTEVIGMRGTGWTNADLLLFTYSGGTWSAEDLTGNGWGIADGALNPGAPVGDGFVFSVRNNTSGANGLWYAQAVPEPVTMAGLALGIGSLATYLRRRRAA